MKIIKGDKVIIIAGKDKGKKGKVLKTFPKTDKVIVEGINMAKKHVKPSQTSQDGGIFDVEMPIHVSNVMYDDSKKGSKIMMQIKDGKKVRVLKTTQQVIK